jgi:hypothetical protein
MLKIPKRQSIRVISKRTENTMAKKLSTSHYIENLTKKLLNLGFLMVMLESSLQKFDGSHHGYRISVSQMTWDMFFLL